MTKKMPIFLFLVILVFAAGCSFSKDEAPLGDETPTALLSATETPTAVPSATNTGQSACLAVTMVPQLDDLPSEDLVLTSGYDLVTLNLKTGQSDPISEPDENIYSPIVSPDGKWLAFRRDFSSDATHKTIKQLVVVSSDGKTTRQFEWENSWGALSYWLDEQNIVVELFRTPPSSLIPLLVLNVTTGATKMLLPDFPGIEDLTFLDWSGSGKTVYNQSVTEIVYPTLGEAGHAYILWDIQKKKIIASLPTRDFSLDGPQWSPSGDGFVVVATGDNVSLGKNEFFWVGTDGKISQLTSFRNEYPIIDIQKWSWSPNGKYIAYWYQIGDGTASTYALGVLDVSTGKSENYCITSLRDYLQGDYLREPLWMKDSSEVVLDLTDLYEKENQVVLLNIQNRTASTIISNMYSVLWLAVDDDR